jgi:nitrogen fixation protein NifX
MKIPALSVTVILMIHNVLINVWKMVVSSRPDTAHCQQEQIMSHKINTRATISREVALRIALAVRSLPDTDTARILNVLDDVTGSPPTLKKLATLTVKILKAAADGEFANIDPDVIRETLAFLTGEKGVDEKYALPEIKQYKEGDMADSIRVACASNNAEELDGHFGSCSRFLVYQVSAKEIRLIDSRNTNGPVERDDKNAYRASLIEDCQLLFVASIGGPAAAKVVKAGVHPVKYSDGGSVRERIVALQKIIMVAPPPWLAKVMGHDEKSRVRFERSVAEA